MEKILIIRFSSLGDVILTTPVTKALKEKYKDGIIHVLVKKEFAGIFKGSPYVDKVIEFDNNKYSSYFKLLKFCNKLNKNDYSIVIDLHRNLRSRIIYRLLSSRRVKLSYKKGALKRRLLVALKIRFKNMPHSVDKYLDTIKPLSITNADRLPFVCLSDEDNEFAKKYFCTNGIEKDAIKIAVSPGAKNKAKMYPGEKFVNLIDMIDEKLNAEVILIGSKSDEAAIKKIYDGVKNKDKVSSLTNADLKQSAAVIKDCDALITNDSGPMHLSVAVKTPLIALFGPTDKRFGFYPLGEKDIVLTKEYNCSPCSLHGKKECIKYNYKCLDDISESEIFFALKKLIKIDSRS